MYKRLLKKIRYFKFIDNYPKFCFGSLLVAVFCTFLIVMSTFTQLKLKLIAMPEAAFIRPIGFFSEIKSIDNLTKIYYYIPQIPVVLFIGALLGPRIGLVSVLIYIISGLIGIPVFASGGGFNYLSQLSFGYIIGYIAGVFLVGNIMASKVSSFSIFRAAVVGVLATHLIGILYLTGLLLFEHKTVFSIFGWVWALSGMHLPYDLIISFLTISLARPARAIFWVAMD